MTDTFLDGTQSVVAVLRPRNPGWKEAADPRKYTFGFPSRAFFFPPRKLFVISAVETMSDEDKGPEYHLSISKSVAPGVVKRCDSNAMVLKRQRLTTWTKLFAVATHE